MKFKLKNGWFRGVVALTAFVFLFILCTAQAANASERDGQRDFDFLIGDWTVHIMRLQHPLSGSKDWIELNGKVAVQSIWNGKADFGEVEADGQTGHFEALTLRTYDPQSHQWNIYFANSKDGLLAQAMTGEFENGKGEFYNQDLFKGRAILVRNIYSEITPMSFHFEQAFSADGGGTWETNWITTFKREAQDAARMQAPPLSADAPEHEFDFELGTWKLHLKKLDRLLMGSQTWTDFYADSVTRTIWGGRGQLEIFEANGAVGRIEGLTLRTYNQQANQWSLYWANSNDGKIFVPQIGEFKGDTGEFYGTYTVNGKYVYVRFIWWPKTAHFEQAFSNDGGRTWEVNWITDQTRVRQ